MSTTEAGYLERQWKALEAARASGAPSEALRLDILEISAVARLTNSEAVKARVMDLLARCVAIGEPLATPAKAEIEAISEGVSAESGELDELAHQHNTFEAMMAGTPSTADIREGLEGFGLCALETSHVSVKSEALRILASYATAGGLLAKMADAQFHEVERVSPWGPGLCVTWLDGYVRVEMTVPNDRSHVLAIARDLVFGPTTVAARQ